MRVRSLVGKADHAVEEAVKVGLLFTYSGPSGMTGQVADNVIKLFQQKNGGTVGGKKVEFVKRDTKGPNPEVVKRLAQERIVREKVNILIGPDFTPNVLAVAPMVTEAKVPTIITGAATRGIVERSPYYLRTFFSVPQVVGPMAQWAYNNGVKPPASSGLMRGSEVTQRGQSWSLPRALTSAPCLSSRRIIAGCRWAAAHINAVWPPQFSFALTLAPLSNSNLAVSVRPVRATAISRVSPSRLADSMSPPARTNACMIGKLPCSAATVMGVAP